MDVPWSVPSQRGDYAEAMDIVLTTKMSTLLAVFATMVSPSSLVGHSRCLGFKGASCTESDTESESLNYSPTLLGLIASLFVVIVLLVGGVFFMIKQLAGYKEDLVNYQVCPLAPSLLTQG